MVARDLPARLVASVNGSIDGAAELPDTQRQLLEHLQSIDDGIRVLIEAIVPMREDIAVLAGRSLVLEGSIVSMETTVDDLHGSLGKRVGAEVHELRLALSRMDAVVKHIDSHIPDPDAPGPLEKAKDAIVGNGT